MNSTELSLRISEIFDSIVKEGKVYLDQTPVTQLLVVALVALIGYVAVLGAVGLGTQPIQRDEARNYQDTTVAGLNNIKLETDVKDEFDNSAPTQASTVKMETPERDVPEQSEEDASGISENQSIASSSATPVRKSTRIATRSLGSLDTPSGRRSARIAKRKNV